MDEVDGFLRSRELASPVKEWDAYISYESVWQGLICDPEPATVESMFLRIRQLERSLRDVQFDVYCAISALKGKR